MLLATIITMLRNCHMVNDPYNNVWIWPSAILFRVRMILLTQATFTYIFGT